MGPRQTIQATLPRQPSAGEFARGLLVFLTALAVGAIVGTQSHVVVPTAAVLVLAIVAVTVAKRVPFRLAGFAFLALLALMTVLGRDFSYLHVGPLFVTDATLGFVGLALAGHWLLQSGPARKPVPWFPGLVLVLYALCGVLAAARGLAGDSDPYYVARDAVLAVYAGVLLITVILFRGVEDARHVQNVLFWASVAATLYALLSVTGLVAPGVAVAQGLYLSFFLLAVLTRWTQGVRVRTLEWGIALLQLGLIVAMTARAAWMALIAATILLVGTGAGRAKYRPAAFVAAGLALALAVLVWAPSSVPETPVTQEVAASVTGTVAPGLTEGRKAANSEWRLEFWKHDLRTVAAKPVNGVGFGPGASFCFLSLCEDTRGSRRKEAFTGPHNSYINIAYRMGLPAITLLLVLIFFGVRQALRGLSTTRAEGRGADVATIRLALAQFTFVAVIAFFSVGLETPYIGLFFWLFLGLLFTVAAHGGPKRAGAAP